MIHRIAIGVVAVLTAATVAGAQKPTDPREVQPERPTVATHAGTVAPGYLEIEAGVEQDRMAGERSTLAPVVLKFGVTSHTQLSVFASGLNQDSEAGFGDIAVGVKWRLLDDAPILGDFALFPSVKFSTASAERGLGTGTTDASLLAISSHEIAGVAIDLNAGFLRRSGDRTDVPKTATVWTASFGGSLAGSAGWVAEAFGYPGTGGPSGMAPTVALLFGPTYRVRNSLALDAGVIVPVAGPQAHALYLGAVYNAGRLW